MTSNLLAPSRDFDRDPRWKRPIIRQADGSTRTYTRVTTFVDVVEDKYNLQRWEKRMVALGLAERPDLILSVQAHRDDKGHLNRLCDEAKAAARASAAATTGTALHALTDMVDRGETLPTGLAAGPAASLEAFRAATAPLAVEGIEVRTVLDSLEVAGTADRLYRLHGQRFIGDTKSGSTIELGTLKIAMQLAVYARSHLYDVETGERGVHGADVHRGIVMHLPATDDPAAAKCELYWIDLLAGWDAVRIARDVRRKRLQDKFANLCEKFEPEKAPAHRRMDLGTRIAGASTAEELRALYRENREVWSADLDVLARRRAGELGTGREAS